MTDVATDALCGHCHLACGRRPMQLAIAGETRSFCCYGCAIAYQVGRGRGEASEAAGLVIRLGVGGFLAMNVMLFSLLLYSDAFVGSDAALVPWLCGLLWLLATPAVLILGGPFLAESWREARRLRITSSALIVTGVGAAWLSSTLALLKGGAQVYFDTATMVLMVFTLGRCLEATGRARAARDLERLLAADSALATVIEDGREHRREPAAGQGAGVGGGCGQRGAGWRAGGPQRRRRGRQSVGADRPGGRRRAGPAQPDPPAGRPGGRRAGSGGARACRRDRGLLGRAGAAGRGDADRAGGAGGRLPLRGWSRGPARDLARNRPARPTRLPGARPGRPGGAGAGAPVRLRQDRHPDRRPAAAGRDPRRRSRGVGNPGARRRTGPALPARFLLRHRRRGGGTGDRSGADPDRSQPVRARAAR